MTVVRIPAYATPPLAPRSNARNGQYPAASFAHTTADLANQAVLVRTKEVARWVDGQALQPGVGPPEWIFGGDSDRDRFRCVFHTSPHVRRMWAVITYGPPQLDFEPDDPSSPHPVPASILLRISEMDDTPLADIVVACGISLDRAGELISVTDVPLRPQFLSAYGPAPFLSWADPSVIATIPGNTTLQLTATELQNARLLSFCVYEESLAPDTDNGYVDPNVAVVLGPIYDARREGIAGLLRDQWVNGSAHLLNWSDPLNPRQNTTTTLRNLIDDTSTGAPSASSLGFTLDLRNTKRVSTSSSGVLVTVWARVSCNSGGRVRLLQDGGAFVDVGPFSDSDFTWVSGTGYLVADLLKCDIQFSKNGAFPSNISVDSVSAYLQG